MAIFYGISGGASILASEADAAAYDPVYQEVLEGPFFWKVLDDYYNLSSDRDVIETFWASLLEVASGDLLRTFTEDATTSLATTPIYSQRRWVSFDLTVDVGFTSDPGLTVDGQGGAAFVWDGSYPAGDELGALRCAWVNRLGADRAYVSLRAPVDEAASLAWSFYLETAEVQVGAFALVGYTNTREASTSALLAGVMGYTGGQTVPCLIHIGEGGEAVIVATLGVLPANSVYWFDAKYSAATRTMTLDVYDQNASRYSTSAGETGEFLGALPVTNTIRVVGADLAGLGVRVGDTLTYEGTSSEISEVAGDTLATRAYLFPTEATGLAFSVTGPTVVGSTSLAVGVLTLDYAHTVDKFGVASFDFARIPASGFITNPQIIARQTLTGATWGWTYADPTSPHAIASIPLLQDRPVNPTTTWEEGVGFRLNRHALGTTFEFGEVPGESLWAEYVAYDERLISSIYGENVGLVGDSSQEYLTRVRGLYFAYYRGPTRGALRRGVHLLMGLPIADAGGTVEEVEEAYSAEESRIRVDGKDYFFPRSVGTSLQVGDTVRQFDPLCGGVGISDWKTEPLWWERHPGLVEIQKYHAFDVLVDALAIDPGEVSLALSFLDKLRPSWKDHYLTATVSPYDSATPTDTLSVAFALRLWDPLGDSLIPRYDSFDYGPYVTDWRYDQLESVIEAEGWTVPAGIQRHPRFPGVKDYLTDLSGVWTLTNGAVAASGDGAANVEVEVGIGVVAFKYAVASRLLSGAAGSASLGASVLTDATPNVFDEVSLGAVLTIGAESHWVVAVDAGAGTVTVEGTFALDYAGAAWEILNPAEYLSRIVSTSSPSDFDWLAVFPGPTGEYVVSLVDRDVTNAYFDQQDETSPEEELEFVASLSVGYGLVPLTGMSHTLTAASTTVTGGVAFETEVYPAGPTIRMYLLDPTGKWHLISSVTDDNTLELDSPAPESLNGVVLWAAQAIKGVFQFTNGSALVTCDENLTIGPQLAAADFIQAVPVESATPLTDSPPVEVLGIFWTGLVTEITLTANYPGVNSTGGAVYRGTTALFPVTITLPTGRNPSDVSSSNLPSFQDDAGTQEVSSTVAEP